jgi:uncharacterized membrane protein YkoI
MKKILSFLAMCAMPLIVTSCAQNPVDPADSSSDSTAVKQTIDSTCKVLIPGTIIEIRHIDENDECTCNNVYEGEVEYEYEHSHDDDSYGHHHNRGRHVGHHKHGHKHKHKHKHTHKHKHKHHDHDDDDDHGHHHHYDHHHTSPDIRSWVVTIIGPCGDTSQVVFTRNGRMVEVSGDSTFCKRDFRPADTCITLDSAQNSVTTVKKGSQVQEWEAEQNPTTKQWKYIFMVTQNDKKYLVAVDAKTGQVTEDKEI